MGVSSKLAEKVTREIIEAIESNEVLPWRQPWANCNHQNLVTKKNYRGINILLLDMACLRHNLTSHVWGTYNQIRNQGGNVRSRPPHANPGEWGTNIIYWSPIKKVDKETEEKVSYLLTKTYCVFNLSQCDGLDHIAEVREPRRNNDKIDNSTESRIRSIIEGLGCKVQHSKDRASYIPSLDLITMPKAKAFDSLSDYYSTLFHEITHWSESRLNFTRDSHKETYGFYELVAELSSCFICRDLGLVSEAKNSKAYIKGWLGLLNADSGAIFKASSLATKVYDFVMSFDPSRKVEFEECSA